ncbi:SDR family NAD(P)-dependent oxidoreductase [Dactylosporangium sp. CA-233914]|uniref:SDR family NAD(P)-dependent oxidoreductase n=1 Tax=Dactylosporangium sp. CA-233914 TaxID=3239934 RepID=UPI003D92183C
MTHQRYSGSVALVTGAGCGIGQATVLRLAHEGATVVGCDVDPAGLEATEKLLSHDGYAATLLEADVADPAGVARAVAALPGGDIDLLANVAGIMDHFLPVTDLDDETWERVIAVNLTGPMRLCRAVIPAMRTNAGGAIVNVASIGALTGSVAGTAYTAAKHGLIGLTRSLAYLYAPDGIRVNAVCPGGVNTGIGRTASVGSQWAFDRLSPSFTRTVRTAEPDEIAGLIGWLGSAEARNVNGAVITSDGGFTA